MRRGKDKMRGAHWRTPEAEPSGAGLRALAILVARALNDLPGLLGTQAALAGGPLGPLVHHVEVTTGSRARGRRPQPNPAAPGSTNSGDAPEDAVDAAVNDEHVETWRLVTLAQQGDGEAFGQLYDRYVDTVFRFVYFRVNDRALAEDFTSETFLRALRRIGTISYQGRDIGAWLVTIARNIIFDHMKSARHRLEITTADTIEGSVSSPSPEAAVIDLLTSERLMAAVKRLNDEQRECVMLRFIQGFSVSETAAVMGKNDGAIKALQHRAVRKLAELVGNELR
jgi:RNA polymerase sigma-70 factor (TIGR02952 family)